MHQLAMMKNSMKLFQKQFWTTCKIKFIETDLQNKSFLVDFKAKHFLVIIKTSDTLSKY